MLAPDDRSLYTEAVKPPPGYVFDEALAATYSLDPVALLEIPLHLALLEGEESGVRAGGGVALLEALRRVTRRVTVYVEAGRVGISAQQNVLYGLLEPVIVEVEAPHGGAFHPKLWLLRFRAEAEDQPPLLRLLVLSRNLSYSRAWDLSAQLEGRPGPEPIAGNEGLHALVSRLPELILPNRSLPKGAAERAATLADQALRTAWDLPSRFEKARFHALGIGPEPASWWPRHGRELVVISPFVTDRALRTLASRTNAPLALLSRPEEMDGLRADSLSPYQRRLVLDEAAETEDGEESAPAEDAAVEIETTGETYDVRPVRPVGLHAKAYLVKRGWYTHLYMGSANATSAALVHGSNVELMLELEGRASRVGKVADFLEPGGLADLLLDYEPSDAPPEEDEEARKALERLEQSRGHLARAPLRLRCAKAEVGYRLVLETLHPIRMPEGLSLRAWPLTVSEGLSVDAAGLTRGEAVDLGAFDPASVTGLIAFSLELPPAETTLRFSCNLEVVGLPEERDASVIRTVVRNRDGFLRYLLLLLGDLGFSELFAPAAGGAEGASPWDVGGGAGLPLLEELVRAYCRAPERLEEAREVVERLREAKAEEDGQPIVPEDFLALWSVVERALEARTEEERAAP